LSDLQGLLELPQLSVLDISDNKISDEKILEEIFEKIPELGVLYTQGNEFVKLSGFWDSNVLFSRRRYQIIGRLL
jgi:Leucine-rich repeat (LRR) protein